MQDGGEVNNGSVVASVVTADAGPDLDALRDERVVPVAKGVLQDMAAEMSTADLSKDTDFTSLLIKILHRTLDADLNLTTENPYVFQLILGAFTAFSTVLQKTKITPTDDVRYSKIGRELLILFAGVDVPMGTKVAPTDQEAAIATIQPQLEAIFERENLTWLELKYILEGMLQSFKLNEQMFSGNVQRSVEKMEAKILGIEQMTDLTMSKLDATLKAEIVDTLANGLEEEKK